MRIAFVTNNGKTIGQHFGRMRYYRVFTIENDKVVNDELREKPLAHHHAHNHGHHHHHSHDHTSMIDPIRDCQVVVAGMMGMGAFEQLRAAGLQVVLTDQREIEQALQSYLKGELVNLAEARLH